MNGTEAPLAPEFEVAVEQPEPLTREEEEARIAEITHDLDKRENNDRVIQEWKDANKPDEKKPEVVVTNQRLRDISTHSITYMIAANTPEKYFVRGRALVRIGKDKKGNSIIEALNESSLRGILERTCNFVRIVERKNVTGDKEPVRIPIPPPRDVVRDILSLGSWPFPPVDGVVTTPVIHLDGSVLTTEGYDPDTRVYYAPPEGTLIPDIPEHPTEEDVRKARGLIDEPFKEFPFVDDTGASRTHIAATLFTIVLRPVIPGSVPALLLDKPTAGTGASLCTNIISVITQGTESAIVPAPKDDDAWTKKITSILKEGITLVCVDNVEHKLYAAPLAAILTTRVWRERLLGLNEMATLENLTIWILNGNNVTLGGDLPRRIIWSRMDAQEQKPWLQEKKYIHPDILAWTNEKRGDILAAILTVVRYWVQTGKPEVSKEVPRLGGFEKWREIIGGILTSVEFTGFLGNLEEMYEEMDLDGTQWDSFINTWYEKWKSNPVTVSDIIDLVKRENDSACSDYSSGNKLSDNLPDDISDAISLHTGSSSKRVGNALRKRRDRFFSNNLRLTSDGQKHKVALWKVIKIVRKEKIESGPGRGVSEDESRCEGGLRGFPASTSAAREQSDNSYICKATGANPLEPPVNREDNLQPPLNSPTQTTPTHNYQGMTRAELVTIFENVKGDPNKLQNPETFKRAWQAVQGTTVNKDPILGGSSS